MKRTQLYLDEETALLVATVGRQKGQTVSELVRESIREKYGRGRSIDKAALARELAGVWRNRKDLARIDSFVRKLRRGRRAVRLRD
jgi:hypothetical protein